MENTSHILTIKEVAEILRCSKAHVQNVLVGRVCGVPRLTHLRLGRRKVVSQGMARPMDGSPENALVIAACQNATDF
jgi:hypothetical protein